MHAHVRVHTHTLTHTHTHTHTPHPQWPVRDQNTVVVAPPESMPGGHRGTEVSSSVSEGQASSSVMAGGLRGRAAALGTGPLRARLGRRVCHRGSRGPEGGAREGPGLPRSLRVPPAEPHQTPRLWAPRHPSCGTEVATGANCAPSQVWEGSEQSIRSRAQVRGRAGWRDGGRGDPRAQRTHQTGAGAVHAWPSAELQCGAGPAEALGPDAGSGPDTLGLAVAAMSQVGTTVGRYPMAWQEPRDSAGLGGWP